jgi:hypothetical protein
MHLLPLGFIANTSFFIARVLLKEIPSQQRRDPRAHNLEKAKRKVNAQFLKSLYLKVSYTNI